MPMQLLLAAMLDAPARGVVPHPCPAPVAVPAEVVAWRQRLYAKDRVGTPPAPVEAAARYRAAYDEARKTDWADLCRYAAENARLANAPVADRQVVFIGDSITEAWSLGDPSLFRHGWINRGISGQTSQQILLRFEADVVRLHPRVVHILAGTNDVAGNMGPTSLDAIENNLSAMVALAKAADIRVVLAAVPPSAAFKWAPELKPAPVIVALNARLRALATATGTAFVDYGAVLATPVGALKPALTYDGTHPDAHGYDAMRPLVDSAIAQALKHSAPAK